LLCVGMGSLCSSAAGAGAGCSDRYSFNRFIVDSEVVIYIISFSGNTVCCNTISIAGPCTYHVVSSSLTFFNVLCRKTDRTFRWWHVQ
jgi:hypothetical protein